MMESFMVGINCPKWNCNYSHPPERNKEALQARFNAYTGTFKNQTFVPSAAQEPDLGEASSGNMAESTNVPNSS